MVQRTILAHTVPESSARALETSNLFRQVNGNEKRFVNVLVD